MIKLDYEVAYKELFNAITDAITELYKSRIVTTQLSNGIKILKEAQCKTEEIYLIAIIIFSTG